MEDEIEEFVDIPGYEGKYQASNLGRIKSLERLSSTFQQVKEKILKQIIDKNGYYRTSLCKNGKVKYYQTHRLIAMAFLKHIPDGFNLVINCLPPACALKAALITGKLEVVVPVI